MDRLEPGIASSRGGPRGFRSSGSGPQRLLVYPATRAGIPQRLLVPAAAASEELLKAIGVLKRE